MKKILTTTALVATMAAGTASAQQNWNLQSTYPGTLPQLGTLVSASPTRSPRSPVAKSP